MKKLRHIAVLIFVIALAAIFTACQDAADTADVPAAA